MARKPKNEGHGHNSGEPLTDDEIAALQHYYTIKLREADKDAAAAKAIYDGKREVINGLFAHVKGDLGYTRKDFQAHVLDKLNMSEAEFIADQNKVRLMQQRAGLPVGAQLDMFADQGDTAGDQARAEAHGYRAGLNAEDFVAPDWVHPILRPNWEHAYGRGQEENILKLGKAEEILAARKAADEPEPEGEVVGDAEPEDEVEALDRAARRLTNSEFMERGGADADEQPAAA